MLYDASLLRDYYPTRNSASSKARDRHSLEYSDAALRKTRRLYNRYRNLTADQLLSKAGIAGNHGLSSSKPSPEFAARVFSRFAEIWNTAEVSTVSLLHVETAFSLLHRRVEAVPHRVDRILSAGLAASVLASQGLRVHLVVETDTGLTEIHRLLVPVFQTMGLSVATIKTGDSEEQRRDAYHQSITLVSARECAMDFLRDANHWPDRGDPVMRAIEPLRGNNSRQHDILMQGLPCAIHLDIDATLIDNARTPIVLTRDAHPMHEVEELKRAVELVQNLEVETHFIFTGEKAEVALTEKGHQQILAWAEQLGGIWHTPNVAESMMGAALTVEYLVKPDVHYRIVNQGVQWMVSDTLVPGLLFYSKPFVQGMVEAHQKLETTTQREVVGRISYQQLFNRYVHLCGMCHSTECIEEELKSVYRLVCRNRWPFVSPRRFNRVHLLGDAQAKLQWVEKWSSLHDTNSFRLIVVNTLDMLRAYHDEIKKTVPGLIPLYDFTGISPTEAIQPGNIVIALSSLLDNWVDPDPVEAGYKTNVVVVERSVRISEDRRNANWMNNPRFANARRSLLLAEDDAIFDNSGVKWIKAITRVTTPRMSGQIIERRIRQMQVAKAKELRKMRKDLLSHDNTMQGLLSFSGRGATG